MWGRSITVVLFGFMDGSATHNGSRVMGIAGSIGEEAEMLALHSKWNLILEDNKYPTRLSEFHMYDCVTVFKEFLEGCWTFAERLTLYGELCDLLMSSNIRPIGASVATDAFQQISAEDLEVLSQDRVQLGTPLDVCFHMITQQILRAVNESGREKTIGVIFDKDNKAREGRFSELCDRYISQYYLGDMFTGYGFADSR
jgi:hypothetical protein